VERKVEVEKLSEEVSVKSQEISERKVGVEAELAEVAPLIEEAQKAVGNIKQNNIDELRFLKMPPVRNVSPVWEPFVHITTINLPRQARHKHRKPRDTRAVAVSAGPCEGRAAGRALDHGHLRHLVVR
jgi:hypothetical protein